METRSPISLGNFWNRRKSQPNAQGVLEKISLRIITINLHRILSGCFSQTPVYLILSVYYFVILSFWQMNKSRLKEVRVFVFFNFIEVQLIYNIVLISAVQQSDSVIHIFFFISFSIMVYHRILNIVSCAIHQDLAVYPF